MKPRLQKNKQKNLKDNNNSDKKDTSKTNSFNRGVFNVFGFRNECQKKINLTSGSNSGNISGNNKSKEKVIHKDKKEVVSLNNSFQGPVVNSKEQVIEKDNQVITSTGKERNFSSKLNKNDNIKSKKNRKIILIKQNNLKIHSKHQKMPTDNFNNVKFLDRNRVNTIFEKQKEKIQKSKANCKNKKNVSKSIEKKTIDMLENIKKENVVMPINTMDYILDNKKKLIKKMFPAV